MSVLITGSTGFIGGHLAKALPNVLNVKRFNLLSYVDTAHTIKETKPDYIIHCAANPNTNIDIQKSLPNIHMTVNLIDAVKVLNLNTKLIFLSSVTVAPKGEENPNSNYAISKLACEKYIQSNLDNYFIIRLGAVVGTNASHGVVPDLVRKLKSDSDKLELFGDYPGTVKPYLHITSLIKYIQNLIEVGCLNRVVSMTGPNSIDINNVANAVMEGVKIYKEKKWLGDKMIWKGDDRFLLANISCSEDFVLHDSYTAVKLAAQEINNAT